MVCLFLVSAASIISGCASRDGIRVPDSAATVSSDKAFALPPPGGPAIVNVIERNFSNAVRQDIFLFTSAAAPGQNVLRISFFGPVGLDYDDREGLPYTSLRDSDIDREMRREVPGVALARSPYYVQNNYGPFGYATGRSRSGDTCLYAWQQIRSSGNGQSAFQNRGTIQVRLRLCDTRATEQQLLNVMYGYTIVGTFPAEGWNPYDTPPKVDPALGRTGTPIYPGAPATTTNPAPPGLRPLTVTSVAASPRPASVRASRVPVQRPNPEPRPTGPMVPSPVSPDQGAKPGSVTVPAPDCTTPAAGGGSCP
jgi:hypothetical protein